MNKAIIGLGSNVPGGRLLIKKSCVEIREFVSSARFSSCYETVPVSSVPQPNYQNCVGIVEAELEYEELFRIFKEMEKASGRTPGGKKIGVVPLDIDIVMWNDEVKKPRDMMQDYMQIGLMELNDPSYRLVK
ncbi:2-amino-4-hydroxy-6-hydroxymethyldihydropteridine diphosphokinase [Coprobacter sp.]